MPKRNNGCPRCGCPHIRVSGLVVCGKCGHRRGEQQPSRDWASEGRDPSLFMDSEPHTVPPPHRGGLWDPKRFSTDPHRLLDKDDGQ
jgi:hypothetical protein